MTVAERVRDALHPMLAAVRDNPAAEAAFWEEAARVRTPLIAEDPSRPGHSVVTYVFAAPDDARHVVVNPGYGQAPDHVMDRIPGSKVLHAAYRYRNDVRTSYSFAPDLPLVAFESATPADMAAMMAHLRERPPLSDPHHREHFYIRAGEGQQGRDASFVALPDAPDEGVIHKRDGIERGRIDRHAFRSTLLENERRIWVYTPPGYDASERQDYPVLVIFDGGGALSAMPANRVLDNLLADGRIRPHVALFVDNATETSRNDELPCSEAFARSMEEELLPWLRANYRVSHAPQDNAVTGVSFGGLASMWFGYRLPHVFGVVISQAASLWWGPGYDTARPLSAQRFSPEWLIEQYAAAPRRPVRYWMEIGLMEHPTRMLLTNRRMKAVMEAKGYDLTYSEPSGGHDYALWRGTLANALSAMLPPV